MKYYTKEWLESTGDEGASVGFQPTADQGVWTDEDIERLYHELILKEYEDDLLDLEEANREEIEELLKKSIALRNEWLKNAEGWPWDNVDHRLLAMGLMPESIFEQVEAIDYEARNIKKLEEERVEKILAKETIPERISSFLRNWNQLYGYSRIGNDIVLAVRPMCQARTQTFLFKDVEILEDEMKVNPGGMAFQVYTEIYNYNDKYEIHMLLNSCTISGEDVDEEMQYFTFRCSDALDSKETGETVVLERAFEEQETRYGVSLQNGYYIPWFEQYYHVDDTHGAYVGRAIYPLLDAFAFSTAAEAEAELQSKMKLLLGPEGEHLPWF